jgi:glutathione S-transferase
MLTLFGTLDSGNVYKAQLILARVGADYRRVDVAQTRNEPRDPRFLAVNPMGKVPVVLREDGHVISESGAILFHFAGSSDLWSKDRDTTTEILRWMFFEQYSHEPALAVMRYLRHFTDHPDRHAGRFAELEPQARRALGVMESRLSGHDWLAAEGCTIADFALYPYTHTAGSVGFDVSRFPGIERWLERVESQPRFVPFGYEGAVETLSFAEYFGSEPEE